MSTEIDVKQVVKARYGEAASQVAVSVLPAVLAIFIGTVLIAWLPLLSTALPSLLRQP